jgi:hypothetical protein
MEGERDPVLTGFLPANHGLVFYYGVHIGWESKIDLFLEYGSISTCVAVNSTTGSGSRNRDAFSS